MEACQNLIKDMNKLQKNYQSYYSHSELNFISLKATLSQLHTTIGDSDQLEVVNFQEYSLFQSQV